jgi:hypothetical protein
MSWLQCTNDSCVLSPGSNKIPLFYGRYTRLKTSACKGRTIITPVIFFVPNALVFRIVDFGSLELPFFSASSETSLQNIRSHPNYML